ncbi:MAG: hypothetical protein PHE30_02185 [Candidatus Omnitrophica bacterium]|nr:hypothetical protein [Candidatus Omnitrophota bacterium]MDD5027602.1 hypothetical protein [Candidatus Omnitrophota bacterium]MDD5662488.1 hypothetical protein [Candidatus Omnitrophota bacterium]
MYRDGQIIKIKCPRCREIKKIRYINKENFGKAVNESPGGDLSSDIKCDCGEKLDLPEDC